MEHIDMNRIREDVQYRFGYVAAFVGFSAEDAAAIKAATPIFTPEAVKFVVDTVYKKLFSYDVTKASFAKEQIGFDGTTITDANTLTVEAEQIKFRKDMLSRYLVRLITAASANPDSPVSGFVDPSLVRYLDRVGKIHFAVQGDGKKKINVDYIHINALFGYVNDILLAHTLGSDLPVDVKNQCARALTKLLWIQNDLFARWIVNDASGVGPVKPPAAEN